MAQPPIFKSFWETRFYGFQWPQFLEEAPEIIEFLYQLRDAEAGGSNIASGIAPLSKSAEGLFESDFDLLDRPHPGIVKLRRFIVGCVQQTVSHVNVSKVGPARITVDICDSWFHITNDGGFHDAHYHSHCSWCGIYYLRLGDRQTATSGSAAPNGGNRFYTPIGTGGVTLDYGNRYRNVSAIDPPLSDGMLLLFPSYLLHSALPYSGNEDRVVIAFNSKSYATGLEEE